MKIPLTIERGDQFLDVLERDATVALGEDVDAKREKHSGLAWLEVLAITGRMGADQIQLELSKRGKIAFVNFL